MKRWDTLRVRAVVKKAVYVICNGVSALLHPLVRIRNHFEPKDRVRVLVYHRVCDMQTERWRERFNISPALFAAQMRLLAEGRYTALTVNEVIQRLRARQGFPPKAVCITFDDGYRNNFTHAFPELCRQGLRASFFVVTDYIDSGQHFAWLSWNETDHAVQAEGPHVWEPLRSQDILEMCTAGMEIGSHSRSHADFSTLQPEEMRREVEESKRALRTRLGDSVSPVFVCPFGVRQETACRLIAVLNECGYLGAFTGRTGAVTSESDPFDLPRLTVDHDDSIAIFRRKVDGAYDWLVWFQPVWVWLTGGRQASGNRKGGVHAGGEGRHPLANAKL